MKVPVSADAARIRRTIRSDEWTSHTSGLAPEHIQGNVVIHG